MDEARKKWEVAHLYSGRITRPFDGRVVFPPGVVLPRVMGFSVQLDPLLPDNVVELRDRDGRVLGRVVNIGKGLS